MIWVVRGEKWNFVPWAVVSPPCHSGREWFGWSEGRKGIWCLGVVFHRTVLVGGSDLGGQRGHRKIALEWRFAALCWWEGVI